MIIMKKKVVIIIIIIGLIIKIKIVFLIVSNSV